MNSLISTDRKGGGLGVQTKCIVVSTDGNGDYTDANAAIAYANGLTISSGERLCIWFRSGAYNIDNSGGAVQIKERIHLTGDEVSTVWLTATTAANDMFTCEANGNVEFSNLQFIGPSSASIFNYDASSAGDPRGVNFYNCKFANADKSFEVQDVNAQLSFYNCSFAQCTTRIGDIIDNSFAALFSCGVGNFGAGGFLIDGTAVGLFLGCEILGCSVFASITGADSNAVATGCIFAQCGKVGSVEDTGAFLGSGNTHIATSTAEYEQVDATAFVVVTGSVMDFSKMTIASGGDGLFNVSGMNASTGEIKARFGVYSSASTVTLASSVIICSTGGVTHTLPAISATSEKFAHRITVINRSGGTVTLQRAGSDTINGGTTATIATLTSKELVGFSGTWFFC